MAGVEQLETCALAVAIGVRGHIVSRAPVQSGCGAMAARQPQPIQPVAAIGTARRAAGALR